MSANLKYVNIEKKPFLCCLMLVASVDKNGNNFPGTSDISYLLKNNLYIKSLQQNV